MSAQASDKPDKTSPLACVITKCPCGNMRHWKFAVSQALADEYKELLARDPIRYFEEFYTYFNSQGWLCQTLSSRDIEVLCPECVKKHVTHN